MAYPHTTAAGGVAVVGSWNGNRWCSLPPEWDSLLAADYPPLSTQHSLLTTHYSLLTTHYSLLTAHYSLLTTFHYSPLTTHQSPLTTLQSPVITHHLLTEPFLKAHQAGVYQERTKAHAIRIWRWLRWWGDSLPCDHHVITIWLPCGCYAIIIWLPHDDYVIAMWFMTTTSETKWLLPLTTHH